MAVAPGIINLFGFKLIVTLSSNFTPLFSSIQPMTPFMNKAGKLEPEKKGS